jgi:hypothetical protein
LKSEQLFATLNQHGYEFAVEETLLGRPQTCQIALQEKQGACEDGYVLLFELRTNLIELDQTD